MCQRLLKPLEAMVVQKGLRVVMAISLKHQTSLPLNSNTVRLS
jgi:hypothetical protein